MHVTAQRTPSGQVGDWSSIGISNRPPPSPWSQHLKSRPSLPTPLWDPLEPKKTEKSFLTSMKKADRLELERALSFRRGRPACLFVVSLSFFFFFFLHFRIFIYCVASLAELGNDMMQWRFQRTAWPGRVVPIFVTIKITMRDMTNFQIKNVIWKSISLDFWTHMNLRDYITNITNNSTV